MISSLQVEELEKIHKKYKLKIYLKRTFYVFLLLLVAFLSYIIFEHKKEKEQNLNTALEEKRKLSKKLQEAKIQLSKAEVLKNKKQPLNNEEKDEKITIKSYNISVSKAKQEFYKEQSFSKAILLAKLYLDRQEYEKSVFWSLKANSLDKNSQHSWLLFARAKKAMGKNLEAKKALDTYVKFYGFNDMQSFDIKDF